MKRFSLWIFVFLIVLYTVNADGPNVILNQTCETGSTIIADNFTQKGTTACEIRGGKCVCDFGESSNQEAMAFSPGLFNMTGATNNLTFCMYGYAKSAADGERSLHFSQVKDTVALSGTNFYFSTRTSAPAGNVLTDNSGGGVSHPYFTPLSNTSYELCAKFYINDSTIEVEVNGTNDGTVGASFILNTDKDNVSTFYVLTENNDDRLSFSGFVVINGTDGGGIAVVPDTTPPVVSLGINLSNPIESLNIGNISCNATDAGGTVPVMNITHNISFDGFITKVNFTTDTVHNVTQFVPAGTYNITCYASDDSNNVQQNSTIFNITVGLPPVVTLINLTSECTASNCLGQIITDKNGSGLGFISHRQEGEYSNLPNNNAFYDGINMSNNVLLVHFDDGADDFQDVSGDQGVTFFHESTNSEFTTKGHINGGRNFSGRDSNDRIKIGDDKDFSNVCNEGCTFTAWAKKIDGIKSGTIMARYDTTGNNRFFRFTVQDNEDTRFIINSNGSNNGQCQNTFSGDDINIDQWYHFVGKFNKSHNFIYINGELKQTLDCDFSSSHDGVDQTLWNDNEDTFIGMFDDGGRQFEWNGTIDEVAFFNRSLSSAEIFTIFQQGNGTRQIKRTNDTTLTVELTTDEAANCAGGNSNLDFNYSDWLDYDANSIASITGGTVHSWTLPASNATTPSGVFNFSWGCEDLLGHQNRSSNSGKIKTNITEANPVKIVIGTNVGDFYVKDDNNTIDFNWSAFDDSPNDFTIIVSVNGTIIYTNFSYSNKSTALVTFVRDVGTYNATIDGTDVFNNKNTTFKIFQVVNDTELPNITILFPVNNSFFIRDANETSILQLNFSATDNMNITLSAVARINSTQEFDTNLYINGSIVSINTTFRDVGFYILNISVADPYGNNATTFIFYEIRNDSEGPNITLIYPINNSFFIRDFNESVGHFNFSAADNINTTLYITMRLNGTEHFTDDSYQNGTIVMLNITKEVGFYVYNVSASDPYGNNVTTFFFVDIRNDSVAPTINISSISNDSLLELDISNNFLINFSCSDNLNQSYAAEVFVNSTQEFSDTSYSNGTNILLNLSRVVGIYEWNLTCIDRYDNVGVETRVFEVFKNNDTPSLTVYFPDNGSVYESGVNNTFNTTFFATDPSNSTFRIQIWRNNTEIFQNSSYVGGTNQTEFFTIDLVGFWNFSVVANDTYGNLNISSLEITILNSTARFAWELHDNLTINLSDFYQPNWTKADEQINFSNASHLAGNFTWNFTEYNVSHFIFNWSAITNQTPWMFNVSNNGSYWNITVKLKKNETKIWYEWRCGDYINITTDFVEIINLTPGNDYQFNCTLNLINITQTYLNWNITKDEAIWDFNWTIDFDSIGG